MEKLAVSVEEYVAADGILCLSSQVVEGGLRAAAADSPTDPRSISTAWSWTELVYEVFYSPNSSVWDQAATCSLLFGLTVIDRDLHVDRPDFIDFSVKLRKK